MVSSVTEWEPGRLSQGDIQAGLWRLNRSLPGRVASQVGRARAWCLCGQASLGHGGRVETDLGLGATEASGRLMVLAFSSVRVLSGLHLFFVFF